MNELSRLLAPDEGRDALRKLAGLLIGLGLVMTFSRKSDSSFGDPWGDWGLLIVLVIAFAFLYGGGLLGRLNTDGLRPWESVYLVFGILLAPLVLLQFVQAVGGTPDTSLNVAWIFAATAGLAVAATFVAGLRYGLLLASLALIVSWSTLWNEILSDGIGVHLGTYRGLLLIVAALLLAAAFAVWRLDRQEGPWRANELVTGAALSAVIGGSLSVTGFLGIPFVDVPTADSSLFWELVLLVVSLLAVGYGSRFGARGTAYIGGFGLLIFLFIAGGDLNGSPGEGKIVGWPLALVLVGAGAFVASLIPRLRIGPPGAGSPGPGPGVGRGAPPPPPGPAGAPPPPPPPAA